MWYFAAGDAGFYFVERLRALPWLPSIWHPEQGFGVSTLARLWFDYPYELVIKTLSTLGLSWWIIDKLLWFSVFALGGFAAFTLARYVLGNVRTSLVASIVYTTNTYVLLLFAGGQIGVALAYSISPLVLLRFMQAIDSHRIAKEGIKYQVLSIKYGIQNGLFLALLVAFDLRFMYLVLIAIALYQLISIKYQVSSIRYQVSGIKYKSILNTYIVPIFVATLVHAFWILPTILASGGISELGEQFTNPGMLKFLSVADFSHAIGFLHPNWPENLFGKVYFMQPEFIVLPILAFASLAINDQRLKIKDKDSFIIHHSSYIVFFALLALLGAFLAKGVQEPGGMIFQWMFTHIPGFVMFRDPTKFYLFIAIGYSVLIPHTLDRITKKYSSFFIHNSLFFIFLLFWLLTIRPVFSGTMQGNFNPPRLFSEYVRLKDTLVNDQTASRVLWIPQEDTFSYMSEIHPLLTSNQLFDNASLSAVIAFTQTPEFMGRIRDAGVGYVIVPTDLEKRLFLADYKFDPAQRDLLVDALRQTALTEDRAYTDVAVFKNDQFTMRQEIPAVVLKQQYWATTGFYVSAVFLITALGVLVVLKYKK